ncbi:hypothetical protein B9Z55_007059 [Caenorhabditis nigoni]|uniref:F-box associated domain-containing protein n=2 Tax=Caenorhabditis nigoni TaxID=1611254 RepID=A0A2G5V884_9PELO|nr:hypothetical protein B9Z55_007059 [Caenorhabditis nigoni]
MDQPNIMEIASISSILDPSRTLRNVSVPHVYSNYQHSFVKNAQQLSICTYTVVINQLAWVFGTMENQRFHFDLMDFHTPSANDYFQLVLAWLGAERRVGSMITLGLRTDQIGEEILELVRSRTERAESTERCVIAPLINGRKLQVSYAPLPEKIHLSTFLLTAKIMEGENSQKID